MHFNDIVYVLAGLTPLAVRADLQLDADDISGACIPICRPILELGRTCDVDGDPLDDRTEDLLTLQCLCTNNSFDVNNIAGLCQSCMTQNPTPDDDDNDDGPNDAADDLTDINEIVSRCGFQPGNFDASQANAANTIVVVATRPNNANQLTTTVGAGGAVTAPTTGTTVLTGSITITSGTSVVTTGTTQTIATTGTTRTTAAGTAPTNTGVTVAGAPGLKPLSGGLKVIGAYLAGVFMLGAWVF